MFQRQFYICSSFFILKTYAFIILNKLKIHDIHNDERKSDIHEYKQRT